MNKTEYLTKRISGLRAVVAVLLAIIMAASVVLGVGFGVYGKNTDDWFKPKQDANQEQQDPEQPGQPSEGEQVESTARVMLMSGATVAAEDGSVSKTLTATITPASAENKKVNWSVSWADDAALKDKNISEYITVTPASDGALTATVTCKKAFRGSMAIVKVVTRDGGYTATCTVAYEGKPTSMSINSGASGKANYLGSNSYTVALENVFGDLGESFYNSISVKSYIWGGTYYGGKYTNLAWSELGTLNIADLANMNEYISVSYSNKKLTVSNIKSLIGAYSSKAQSSQGEQYLGRVQKDVDMYVDVTLAANGVEKTIRVDFENVTITANGGKNGSCNLLLSATFDVALGNLFGTFNKEITVQSFTWGGTYYGGDCTNGTWSNFGTLNISDLKNMEEYISVSYSNKKLTVSNTKALSNNAYQEVSFTSRSTKYTGLVQSNVNMYVDVVLACGDSTATFRVNFTSGVNSVSLNESAITF